MQDKIERKEPKRWMDKQEALRRLIHTSIRLIVAEEDPFVVNHLAQSAEKVGIDLLRRRGISDPFSFEPYLVPEHKKEFYALYRANYNFFKHADTDHDGRLPVYGVVQTNDVLMLGCIARYQKLFSELTRHMQHFNVFLMVSYPHLIRWDEMPKTVSTAKGSLSAFQHQTRGQLLKLLHDVMVQFDSEFLQERSHDLTDVREASSAPAVTRGLV